METIFHWENNDNPTSKFALDDIKEALLVEQYYSFLLLGKKLDHLHLKDFLKYECELYLKQPLPPPQCKIIIGCCTTDCRLGIKLDKVDYSYL